MLQKTSSLISSNRRFIPLAATIGLAVVAYVIGLIIYPSMRDPQIFLNLFRTSPFLLISAIGMTFVIISGGIDLSVSGVVALTTVAAAALIRAGWNPWLVILLMLAMGMALGATMGSFITYLKVQPFIVTLAGMWFARGMSFFISDDAIAIHNRVYDILGKTRILIPGLSNPTPQEGDGISNFVVGLFAPVSRALGVTGQGDFISILAIFALAVLAVSVYIAHYTRFGRTIYAMGGNEQSARLMGLPVNRAKVGVYTLNGFCSALAGIALSIDVSSGHGLYATGFELDVIASVVMGGTMLTGGAGYVFGTLFGVLVFGITQTLIQFNGQLSSWWTKIVIGILTLVFIGVQSLLAARKARQAGAKAAREAGQTPLAALRNRPALLFGGGAILLILLVVPTMALIIGPGGPNGPGANTAAPTAVVCQPKWHDQVRNLTTAGAVVAYERTGGPRCLDELFAIYPDGRITGNNGTDKIEKQVTPAEVEQLLAEINAKGWFTDELYDTWHPPCRQCFEYLIGVSYQGQTKTVKAVSGGTDSDPNYLLVVALINGITPKFS